MRRSAPCLLALLIALPAGATAARVPAAVTLGGMLSHALPAINVLAKNSPVPAPALLDAGSLAEARKLGLLRSEGKTYVVQDGDVAHILFNV